MNSGLLCSTRALRSASIPSSSSYSPRPSPRLAASSLSPSPLRSVAVRASTGDNGSSGDSDLVYVLKLLGACTLGGAVVKWGSLLLEAPFDAAANAPLALALVLGPPFLMSLWFLAQKKDDSDAQ